MGGRDQKDLRRRGKIGERDRGRPRPLRGPCHPSPVRRPEGLRGPPTLTQFRQVPKRSLPEVVLGQIWRKGGVAPAVQRERPIQSSTPITSEDSNFFMVFILLVRSLYVQ